MARRWRHCHPSPPHHWAWSISDHAKAEVWDGRLDHELGLDLRVALAREVVGDPRLAQDVHVTAGFTPPVAVGIFALDHRHPGVKVIVANLQPVAVTGLDLLASLAVLT